MYKKKPKYGPIGLDVGTSSLKMIQLQDDGDRPSVLAAVSAEIPYATDDPDARREAILQKVGEALRQQPFQGRQVVSALSTADFQMKNLRLPKMPPDDLHSAIEFEAQDRFGLEPDSAQFRWITAGEVRHGNELKEEIMVFAAPNDRVRSRLELLEACRLEPVALDITPCAVARSFIRFLRRAEDAESVNVFMDVGWTGTCIVITRGTHMMFLKMIDVGGRHLNSAVAKALDISPEEAADLRIRVMRCGSGRRAEDQKGVPEDVEAAALDAVRPLVERLARDVQLCLRYFAVTFRGQRPDSLTFVGGEAHEPALEAVVSSAVDVPCTIGHPLRGIGNAGLIGGRDRRSFQPAWSVACGLALRGSQWVQGPETRTRVGPRVPTPVSA